VAPYGRAPHGYWAEDGTPYCWYRSEMNCLVYARWSIMLAPRLAGRAVLFSSSIAPALREE